MRWSVSAFVRAASEYARTLRSYPSQHWPFGERLPSVETDLARLFGAKPRRRNRRVAVGAGAAVVLGVCGLAVFLGVTLTGARASHSCGLVKCHTAVPAAAVRSHGPSASPSATAPSPVRHRRRHHRHPAPLPSPPDSAPPGSDPPPSPVPPPTPTPTPQPLVSAHYRVTWGGPEFNAFRAQFTLVNRTGHTLDGWSLAADFAGDQVQWVYAEFPGQGAGPFQSWQDHRGWLVLAASPGWAIPPGGRETVFFQAAGGQVNPGSCTFDGTPCAGL